MSTTKTVLAIDVGSIAVSIVEMDPGQHIIFADYRLHHGESLKTIHDILGSRDLSRIEHLVTTASTPVAIKRSMSFDSRIAYIAAAKHLHVRVGSLLIIGGEQFGLVLFDENGGYLNYRSNSSCAAGTGSFLDQQAKRLNLAGIEEFCRVAGKNSGEFPKIASRCSVFAKTDLIHAQQEGYRLEEICDGLCAGLAKNVADTVFAGTRFQGPVIMAGGVARNQPVVRHLSQMIDDTIQVDDYAHLYGAIGAALLGLKEKADYAPFAIQEAGDIIQDTPSRCEYHYGPLTLNLSQYPEFASRKRYEYQSHFVPGTTPVETDVYEAWEDGSYNVYMGIDIGSTSTKAVLMDHDGTVLAGFYTRTSGRPIEAVQSILETIDDVSRRDKVRLTIRHAGTTGSGRKFIGAVIGADLILDEISAHARAAYALDPRVDTIIEIGGQDAKFTTMKNGAVTFSIMNSVCAAGTGSFIEEQAKKLDCPIQDYARRAEDRPAPLASDRCTVFMERDLNYYLNEGYAVEAVLASVLHSVRENYLTKVAIEKNIGQYIFFQGATAKNRALVAAFEQRLQKPIMVSRFCHLTGALGVALELRDAASEYANSKFKGLGIYQQPIPVSHEVCELCTNHCKIRVAEVDGRKEAYGFLCGRDYESKTYVPNQQTYRFLIERKKIFRLPTGMPEAPKSSITVGLPAALHMIEELPLWQHFFRQLGINTVTSTQYADGIKAGKHLTGAEFCAPITALHGHAAHLAGQCDFLFLPFYLEHKQKFLVDKTIRRQYCYYTQYAPAITAQAIGGIAPERILTPVLHSIQGSFYLKAQLYKALKQLPSGNFTFLQIATAYDRARQFLEQGRARLKKRFNDLTQDHEVKVVLLGRPYTVLSPHMNNGIPEIFARLNVKTFYQDMLSYDRRDVQAIAPLLKAFNWHYAVQILEAAEVIGNRQGLYPVLVTSFKCAPDSFVIDYFKKIMEAHNKPYLILQLDEHDSSVGYETRIEAGLRAFRNHLGMPPSVLEAAETVQPTRSTINPVVTTDGSVLRRKTILIPRWDTLCGRLVTATLRSEGIDARLVDETPGTIRRSMRHNSGQCIPLNICIQNAAEYIEAHQLDPEKTALWIFNGTVACNIQLYPYFMKSQLAAMGRGLEKVDVYVGEITFSDISYQAMINIYFDYMFGGMLRRVACSLRPYEVIAGQTDSVLEEAIGILEKGNLNRQSREASLVKALALFDAIKARKTARPKVALFGDLYVRDNDVLNQNLIRTIEANGGEVISTPYNEYLKIVAEAYIKKWIKEGYYGIAATATITRKVVGMMERKYMPHFKRFLPDAAHRTGGHAADFLKKLSVTPNNTGESMDNLLKIYSIIHSYPDIALFVQTNPAFCCPSLITEAMADKIEILTGVPVLTVEYDGTGSAKNADVIPYLTFPRKSRLGATQDKIASYE